MTTVVVPVTGACVVVGATIVVVVVAGLPSSVAATAMSPDATPSPTTPAMIPSATAAFIPFMVLVAAAPVGRCCDQQGSRRGPR